MKDVNNTSVPAIRKIMDGFPLDNFSSENPATIHNLEVTIVPREFRRTADLMVPVLRMDLDLTVPGHGRVWNNKAM